MEKRGFTYILTNRWNTVLYVGVTSNLEKRLFEHRNNIKSGFAKKFNLNKLVYYERYESISDAIIREKQIKGKTRSKKNDLINLFNPNWNDLSHIQGDSSLCSE